MAIKNMIAGGIGFLPGINYWIFTGGLGAFVAPPFPPVPVGPPARYPAVTNIAYLAMQKMIVAMDTANVFDTSTVHLFQNNIFPSPDLTIASFTEADYTGYAAQSLGAFAGAFANDAGDVVAEFPHNVFVPTGSAVGNTIYGWWVQGPLGGGSPELIDVRRLDTPVQLTSTLTALVAEPRVPFGQPRGD